MRADRTRIKICGITRFEDAEAAVAAGADALGFIGYEGSPRNVDLLNLDWIGGLPPYIVRVAVVVDPDFAFLDRLAASGLFDAVQLHGHEGPELAEFAQKAGLRPVKVFRPRTEQDWTAMVDYPTAALHIDTPSPDGRLGGSGAAGDWEAAARFVSGNPARPVILSGGLNPRNARAAVVSVRPYAVDVASGVERAPGLKDPAAMKRFCEEVRIADAMIAACAQSTCFSK